LEKIKFDFTLDKGNGLPSTRVLKRIHTSKREPIFLRGSSEKMNLIIQMQWIDLIRKLYRKGAKKLRRERASTNLILTLRALKFSTRTYVL